MSNSGKSPIKELIFSIGGKQYFVKGDCQYVSVIPSIFIVSTNVTFATIKTL